MRLVEVTIGPDSLQAEATKDAVKAAANAELDDEELSQETPTLATERCFRVSGGGPT